MIINDDMMNIWLNVIDAYEWVNDKLNDLIKVNLWITNEWMIRYSMMILLLMQQMALASMIFMNR